MKRRNLNPAEILLLMAIMISTLMILKLEKFWDKSVIEVLIKCFLNVVYIVFAYLFVLKGQRNNNIFIGIAFVSIGIILSLSLLFMNIFVVSVFVTTFTAAIMVLINIFFSHVDEL
jgi:hypothetical protein